MVDESQISLALLVAYDGQPFHGFARQKDPHLLTVQGEIERALELLVKRPVETVCSGRTDAGVHAYGQVVSFCLDEDEWSARSPHAWFRALNALTHEGVQVRDIAQAPAGFSARFDALSRSYRYYIAAQPFDALALKDMSWRVNYVLNIEAMQKAAHYMVGEHDFKSFCISASAEGRSTVRTVHRCEVQYERIMNDDMVRIDVVGNAFLHSMVRTMVGTLVSVGRGQHDPEWVIDVIEARSRAAAGEKAPACGLTFMEVAYPDGALTWLDAATLRA